MEAKIRYIVKRYGLYYLGGPFLSKEEAYDFISQQIEPEWCEIKHVYVHTSILKLTEDLSTDDGHKES